LYTGVILAGGRSRRFGENKALVQLVGKPLIVYVHEQLARIVDEIIIVISKLSDKSIYTNLLGKETTILTDLSDIQIPLMGALTGFTYAKGEYTILLSCDTPFISQKVMRFLLDMSKDMNAVIPRWPNGYIEPIQAVYKTHPALQSTKGALRKGKLEFRSMINDMQNVRYVSTSVIEKMDPALISFFNINTLAELRKAEETIRKRNVQDDA